MKYLETTRYGHFKSINIIPGRLTCTAISPHLGHLRGFGSLQEHLNYMVPVPASLLKLNTED